MKVWQIHSGPYSDHEHSDQWWLVAKVETDEGELKDVEITFSDMDSAIKFKNEVDLAWEPVEVKTEGLEELEQ